MSEDKDEDVVERNEIVVGRDGLKNEFEFVDGV